MIKKVKKIPKNAVRNGNTITEVQYFSKIRSILRNGFRYWKPLQLALEKSSRPSQSINKRIKKEYKCKTCRNWFKRADVEIDHVIPCGSLNNYEDIVPFIKNLSSENLDNYQILCKPCHLIKTNIEKSNRKNKKI
jgi:5-methylcytosine-specific restriction endonuclease McrA